MSAAGCSHAGTGPCVRGSLTSTGAPALLDYGDTPFYVTPSQGLVPAQRQRGVSHDSVHANRPLRLGSQAGGRYRGSRTPPAAASGRAGFDALTRIVASDIASDRLTKAYRRRWYQRHGHSSAIMQGEELEGTHCLARAARESTGREDRALVAQIAQAHRDSRGPTASSRRGTRCGRGAGPAAGIASPGCVCFHKPVRRASSPRSRTSSSVIGSSRPERRPKPSSLTSLKSSPIDSGCIRRSSTDPPPSSNDAPMSLTKLSTKAGLLHLVAPCVGVPCDSTPPRAGAPRRTYGTSRRQRIAAKFGNR